MNKFLTTFCIALACVCCGVAYAVEPVKGIFATYEGASTSYKLEDVPKVTYTTIGGVQYAVLSFENVATTVRFALEEGKTLEISYGEYQSGSPTEVEEPVSITTENGRKIFRGGRLIILKDGKMYDAQGRIVE